MRLGTIRVRTAKACFAVLTMAALAGCAPEIPDRIPTEAAGVRDSGESVTGSPFQYRHTKEEFLLLVLDCVRGRGYDVEFDLEDERFSGDFGDRAASRAFGQALGECLEEVDPARADPPPLTDDQYRELYAYTAGQVECLRQRDYPAGDPPPEQVWVDSQGEWNPYVDLVERNIAVDDEDRVHCQNAVEEPRFYEPDPSGQ